MMAKPEEVVMVLWRMREARASGKWWKERWNVRKVFLGLDEGDEEEGDKGGSMVERRLGGAAAASTDWGA